MKVYIDSREQDMIQNITSYYKEHKDKYRHIESIEVKTLTSGDLCTADKYFGCERKSSADFISSVLSAKIKQQLYELRRTYKNPYLLVEGFDGIMDCINKNFQLHPNVIIGATTSAFAHNGVPIQYVGGLYIPFVLQTIDKLYDGKKEHYESLDYIPFRHTTTKKDFLKYFVLGLPGIKGSIGSRLLQQYNSVGAIVNAPVEELQRVKGIGKGKAKQIKSVLK